MGACRAAAPGFPSGVEARDLSDLEEEPNSPTAPPHTPVPTKSHKPPGLRTLCPPAPLSVGPSVFEQVKGSLTSKELVQYETTIRNHLSDLAEAEFRFPPPLSPSGRTSCPGFGGGAGGFEEGYSNMSGMKNAPPTAEGHCGLRRPTRPRTVGGRWLRGGEVRVQSHDPSQTARLCGGGGGYGIQRERLSAWGTGSSVPRPTPLQPSGSRSAPLAPGPTRSQGLHHRSRLQPPSPPHTLRGGGGPIVPRPPALCPPPPPGNGVRHNPAPAPPPHTQAWPVGGLSSAFPQFPPLDAPAVCSHSHGNSGGCGQQPPAVEGMRSMSGRGGWGGGRA